MDKNVMDMSEDMGAGCTGPVPLLIQNHQLVSIIQSSEVVLKKRKKETISYVSASPAFSMTISNERSLKGILVMSMAM
jgi:hypothetical protein